MKLLAALIFGLTLIVGASAQDRRTVNQPPPERPRQVEQRRSEPQHVEQRRPTPQQMEQRRPVQEQRKPRVEQRRPLIRIIPRIVINPRQHYPRDYYVNSAYARGYDFGRRDRVAGLSEDSRRYRQYFYSSSEFRRGYHDGYRFK